MKKLPIFLLLFTFTACAHKPVASPEDVNQYLDTLCHISADFGYEAAFEGTDRIEMHRMLPEVLWGND